MPAEGCMEDGRPRAGGDDAPPGTCPGWPREDPRAGGDDGGTGTWNVIEQGRPRAGGDDGAVHVRSLRDQRKTPARAGTTLCDLGIYRRGRCRSWPAARSPRR